MTDMLELHVAEEEISTGIIPITWCVRHDIIDKLNSKYLEKLFGLKELLLWFNVAFFALIVVSTVLYLKVLHFKKRK